ncbi:hypothetical protein KW782_01990 [Candidatus Parcubacteria bacterium]|nr:hypothetical protein [Candidatus Parcubacteria bacterium]
MEDEKKKSPLPPIHTYSSDLADTLKGKELSMLDIAVSQNQKKQSEPIIEVKKNIWLLPISLILLFGCVLAALIIFGIQRRLSQTAPPSITKADIIATEGKLIIPIAPGQYLEEAINDGTILLNTAPGSLVRFSFILATTTAVQIPIPVESIAGAFGSIPSYFVRALQPDYVLGYHTGTEFNEPFIIFKTSSYETAFSGMIAWEKTMVEDVQPLFVSSVHFAENPTSTYTFSDAIIRNKDVRIAKNAAGQPVLYYALTDKETIVMTTNEETFAEIIGRLATSQFVQ